MSALQVFIKELEYKSSFIHFILKIYKEVCLCQLIYQKDRKLI